MVDMSVISAFKRLRQEYFCEFKAILVYIVSLKQALVREGQGGVVRMLLVKTSDYFFQINPASRLKMPKWLNITVLLINSFHFYRSYY